MQTEDRPNKEQSVEVLWKMHVYKRYIKRLMDFVLSLFAIIVLSPILFIVAAMVKVNLGSQIIFKQSRPGLNEKIYNIYKFRTMTDIKDEKGELLPDELRLTRFGKILRCTSLDELPELFNILKGDMSIVGPRPLLIQYLPLYNSHQRRRHEVRPGLSGLAQISGRNSITWEERFDLDVKYIDNISFIGDWKIILMTIIKVFKREGINSSKSETMPAFQGTMIKLNCKNKLLIIGAGGHGKVICDIALKMNRWKQIFFLDDNERIKSLTGLKVIGKASDALSYINDYDMFIAIGNNETRERIQSYLLKEGASIQTLVHPNAIVGSKVEIGVGTVVMAGAVINCYSKIGDGCIVNTGSTIDHDNMIENFTHISPGVHLAGNVRVGERVWLGTGAIVINNINIINECIIGAGAVVVNDINEVGVYVGVPAKPIKY